MYKYVLLFSLAIGSVCLISSCQGNKVKPAPAPQEETNNEEADPNGSANASTTEDPGTKQTKQNGEVAPVKVETVPSAEAAKNEGAAQAGTTTAAPVAAPEAEKKDEVGETDETVQTENNLDTVVKAPESDN